MKKDLRTGRLNKIIYKLRWFTLRLIKIANQQKYILGYRKLLQDYGMNIAQDAYYIDPSVYFDNYDYGKISIGGGQ